MMYAFIVHWQLRKGLGPEWIKKTEEICFDDLPEETTEYEARQMARHEFKAIRAGKMTHESEYIIEDIISI